MEYICPDVFRLRCFPLLVQMSKESTLADAIDHIKKLQNQVLELQQQLADSPGEAWEKQGSASCSESFAAAENMPYQVIAAAMNSFIYTTTITVQLVEEEMLGHLWTSESTILDFF